MSISVTLYFETLGEAETVIRHLEKLSNVELKVQEKKGTATKRKRGKEANEEKPVAADNAGELPQSHDPPKDNRDLEKDLRDRLVRLMQEGRHSVFSKVFDEYKIKKFVELSADQFPEVEKKLITTEAELYPDNDPLN